MSNAGVQAEAAKQGIMSLTAQKDLLERTGEVSDSLNLSQPKNQEAGTYGNMACDAVGLAGAGEMLGLLGSVLTGETSYKGMNTLEGLRKGNNIKTKPMGERQDLLCRSKNVSDFNANSGTGEMAGKQQMAGLNNQIQHMQALLKGNQLALGMGNQAKLIKGHEQRLGLQGPGGSRVPQLALNAMQPKGPTEDITSDVKDRVDDGTTSWA